MKQRKSSFQLITVFVSFAAILLFLTGCEGGGPSHRTADFSPEGTLVAVITNEADKEPYTSEVSIRRADAENAEAHSVYSAPTGMEIFDVFWKNDKMVVFESGETWACPDAEEFREKHRKEKIPTFDIRIVALNGSFAEGKSVENTLVYYKTTRPCWEESIETIKKEEGRKKKQTNYDANKILQWTNISDARNADLIIYESLNDSWSKDKRWLNLLDTKTGRIIKILEGRNVSAPSISWDGKKAAFIEVVGREKTSDSENINTVASDGNPGQSDKPHKTIMKIVNLDSGVENEVMMIAELKGDRPMWSKDGNYLFIPGISNIAYTTECDRKHAEMEYAKMMIDNKGREKNHSSTEKANPPDDSGLLSAIDLEKATRNGFCKTVRGNISEKARNTSKNIYDEYIDTWYTLHKYYSDIGIAVRLLDHVSYFSVNPETEQILAKRILNPLNDKKGLWLVDYSGSEIREVKYGYVKKFDAVNKYGMAVGSVNDDHGSVPVLLNTATDAEKPLIGRKQDLLTLANYNFDHGRYNKAKECFEKYVSSYGLPEETGYRLIMLATYRETKDYDKMMKLTRTIPVEEIQRYFSVSGKI